VESVDLTFNPDDQMQLADRQFVSGCMFDSFGLKPALGLLLTRRDDVKSK
jgi:hypothetical protein